MTTKNLILILGDQLNKNVSSLVAADKTTDRILMVEVMEEVEYAWHHSKKIAFIFSTMRHFAEDLRKTGWTVDYTTLDGDENSGSFVAELHRAIAMHDPDRIVITEPGEWRLLDTFNTFASDCARPVDILEDNRFICSHTEFSNWADGRKQLRMEYFYREMRRKTGLLMDGDQPEGGKWNFDSENRKPAKGDMFMPTPRKQKTDTITRDVLTMIADRLPDQFGTLEPFWFAVTARQAEQALEAFIDTTLPQFGDYQDAMLTGEPFLYHSLLSLYINVGLLDPLDVCRRVDHAWRNGDAPLNAAEGFIRQVIGWREYVRGVYWMKMPDYRDANFLDATRPLPKFYWTGETEMACVRAVVTQTIEEGYAHHIQRLMITGNFALLAGVSPQELHEWYLAVYVDAFEWVELPNTLGMSQFADGGLLGSKPYAASGNYISKMSDYCGDCPFNVKKKTGDDACPFNALYWDFLLRNEEKLRGNPRLSQIYRNWDRMDVEMRKACRVSAAKVLKSLD